MGEELNCVNYELCEHTAWSLNGECCKTCGSWFKVGGFGWDKLTFIDCVDEECDVCLNSCNRKLLFPTNCGHSFCIRCSENFYFLTNRNIIKIHVIMDVLRAQMDVQRNVVVMSL